MLQWNKAFWVFAFVYLFLPLKGFNQELFPNTEPASTIPKNVVGIRAMYEGFKELPSRRDRHWGGVRIMYGLTGRLTIMATVTGSNHHLKNFPVDLRNYFINHHQVFFKQNPYLIEGSYFYVKYRWFSKDEKKKHIRLTFYGEGGKSFVAHDEAEPVLGDNTALGGGIIGTKLHNRFAISITAGYLHPLPFREKATQIEFITGDSWSYNLSLGYRVFPFKYTSYNNVNVNVYLEFINKHYQNAIMTKDGKLFDFDIYQYFDPIIYNGLIENQYSEMRPSIQFIFNSKTRLDLGMALPVYGRSYLHFYPLYFLNFQQYIFPVSKRKGNGLTKTM